MTTLTVQEIIELVREADESRRAKLRRTLADAGADPDTVLRELKQHDRFSGNVSELRLYALTLEGSKRITEMRHGVNTQVFAPGEPMAREAYRLLGWNLDELVEGPTADPTASQSPSSGTG